MTHPETRGSSGGAPALLALILAVVGFNALPRAQTASAPPIPPSIALPKGGESPASEGASSAVAAHDDPYMRIAQPLIDFLDAGRSPTGDESKAKNASLRQRLKTFNALSKANPGSGPLHIYTLIATVTDPVDSSNSHRFDEIIGTIQRAAETQRFVLDRYRFPWPVPKSAPAWSIRSLPQPASLRIEPAASLGAQTLMGDPGVLLFRRENQTTLELLLVLLVPENPFAGLMSKAALRTSLDLVDLIQEENETDSLREFRILGPCFTGTQTSLLLTLESWCEERKNRNQRRFPAVLPLQASPSRFLPNLRTVRNDQAAVALEAFQKPSFKVIIHTGMAAALKPERFRRRNAAIQLHATIQPSDVILREMIRYLGDSERIALLVESNTGYGEETGRDRLSALNFEKPPAQFQFPMHISQVRSTYEQRGLFEERTPHLLRSSERIDLPFEEQGRPSDLPRVQTPAYSVAKDELMLNQVMQTIDRGHFKTVGIVATDPRDVVFLVKRLRTFVPNVRIFTINADLIYCHAQVVAELRGTYIGSTYSLSLANQLRSYPFPPPNATTRGTIFSTDDLLGVYNAVVLHLEAMVPTAPTPSSPASPTSSHVPTALREYGPPRIDESQSESLTTQPPVWISRIGYDGIHPISVVIPHGANSNNAPDTSYLRSIEVRPDVSHSGWQGVPAQADRYTWWLFCGLLSLATAGLVVVSYKHFDWKLAVARGDPPPGPEWLARFMCWSGSDDAFCPRPYRGPGYILVMGQLLTLATYTLYCLPMLSAAVAGPRLLWAREALGLVVVAVLLAGLLAAIGWTLIAEIHHPDRPGLARVWTSYAGITVLVLTTAGWTLWFHVGNLEVPKATLRRVEAVLFYEQALIFPSGVSPSFPGLFLFVASWAWMIHGLRRRYVVDQLLLESRPSPSNDTITPNSQGHTPLSVDRSIHRSLEEDRRQVEALLHSPRALFGCACSARGAAVAALVAIFFSVSWLQWSSDLWQPDTLWSTSSAGWLIFALYIALIVRTAELWWLWDEINDLLKGLARLPLTGAFKRLPPQVARWFSESPRIKGGRSLLIRRQAAALVAHANDSVRASLTMVERETPSVEDWNALMASLNSPPRVGWTILEGDQVMSILESAWQLRTVTATALDSDPANSERSMQQADRANGEGWSAKSLEADAWVRDLEELVALAWLRWLSLAVAIVWATVGFLALCLVALTLATTSYSFDFQHRMLTPLGILAVVLTILIARIVIGLGRDEVLSRLSNSTTHWLNIDGQLLANLMTSLLPMLGLLAALSLDISNMIRTLIDPILRYLNT